MSSLEATPPAALKLIAKSEKAILVDRKAAQLSAVLKVALDAEASVTELDYSKIDELALEQMCEYLNHHAGVQPKQILRPLRSCVMSEICPDPWDASFIDRVVKNRAAFFQLFMVANYFDVSSLVQLCAAKTASLAKGQSLEAIKNRLTKDDNKNDGESSNT